MEQSVFEARFRDSGHRLGLDQQGIRETVATLLKSIPSAGFFKTYTDHSIAHCDQMLAILSWLIPEPVRTRLTDVEHALLVLSVYLHDLGMLATEDEFRNRQNNAAFARFESAYTQQYDNSSANAADHDSWDRFLFEEFIRHTHAQRIADWIAGKNQGLIQAIEIDSSLKKASPHLRHCLATLCRSHHLNDLHDRTAYPVDSRFGNSRDDEANIQFLSVCLRLADILHMSRDRTPSLEFRLISPRNPISAREWAKQLQVSGVGPSQSDPTEIRLDAFCTDHRMYFYLQDFIRIVNEELARCRAWLETSPAGVASRYYLVHRLVTDEGLRAEGFLAEKFQLELDQRRVIDLLMGHNLYGDPHVAIRELLQNSIDAVRVRAAEAAEHSPRIVIHLDRTKKVLTVQDNGIGMDLEVIRRHFLRVGDSYYRSAAFRRRCPGYTPISQFGIGFLTAFMLGNRVDVLTRSNRADAKTYMVDLENVYDLFLVRVLDDDAEEAALVRDGGTRIRIFLRDDVTIDRLREQVEKWLVFLEFPVQVSENEKPPELVWGLQGDTPEEVGRSIADRLDDSLHTYCPIVFSREGINVTVLWEGYKTGDDYLLAPAGRFMLPLTARWTWTPDERHMRQKEPKLVRKIANGGVFLSDELPGVKFAGRVRVHYVIDCRGERRFTPLVSRSGVKLDNSCVEIVQTLVTGLIDALIGNIDRLMATGISKYFAAYYAGSAIAELFAFERSESEDELVLSVLLAVQHGQNVPMLLVKEPDGIALKSWKDHGFRELVVGRNVYQSLLRSVTHGYVEFPLPSEVLRSLPESYVLDVGTEKVLKPLFLLSGYSPVAVEYDAAFKGVFLKCQVKKPSERDLFGGLPLLEFPDGLADVTMVQFTLAGCLNVRHPGIGFIRDFARAIVRVLGDERRQAIESELVKVVSEAGWEWKRHPFREEEDLGDRGARRLKERLTSKWPEAADVPIDLEKLGALTDARIIRDELWSMGL